MGRFPEALAEAERAKKIDPLGELENFGPGSILVFWNKWDQAIEQFRNAVDLDPNFWFDHCFLGRADEQKGKLPAAIAEFRRALELDNDQRETWSGLGHAFAIAGNKDETQKVISHLGALSKQSYVAPYNVAVIYVGLGDKDQAFQWLNQAYEDRSYLLALYRYSLQKINFGVRWFGKLHRFRN